VNGPLTLRIFTLRRIIALLKKLLLICLLLLIAVQLQPARLWMRATADVSITATLDLLVSPAADPDPRNETAIAVSPVNQQIIVGASKVIVGGGNGFTGNTRVAIYHSSDGGRTWATSLLSLETLEKTWGRAASPSIAVDANGIFYLCVVMLDNANFDSSVYVFTSTDGGQSFTNPLPVTFDIGSGANPKIAEKSFITVDTSPTSLFKNSIYVVWAVTDRDNQGQNRKAIKLAYKRPSETAFSDIKTISHEGDMRGPSVTTGPGGEVYAAWEGIGNPKVILLNASTDGGNTFLPLEVAPSIDLNVHNFTGSLSDPSPALFISGMSRMNCFPAIDVDRSSGPNRGMIYIAWAETTNRNDADVFVKKITPPNGGHPTIGEPVRVNNDASGSDQFLPWLKVDSSNGNVEVAFYDRRDDGQSVNMYIARSTDGGAAFPENTRVSALPSNPRIQSSVTGNGGSPIGLGNYVGLFAASGKAHLLWADTRDQKQNIYYGLVEYETSGGGGGGGSDGVVNDKCQTPEAISSLPFNDSLDTRNATSSADDPVSCSGNPDANSVWYSLTPSVNTVYGIDTIGSDYNTVLSVYTGSCGALTRIACSDDFGNAIVDSTRSLLTFSANPGTTYLIEVSGKASGGNLKLRIGFPTVTFAEYTTAPDGSEVIRVLGAGFLENNTAMIIQKDVEDTPLNSVTFINARQGDGTYAELFGTKKKLRKLIKPGRSAFVKIESPIGSGRFSVPFFFTRQ
jgi:hypothetical protein